MSYSYGYGFHHYDDGFGGGGSGGAQNVFQGQQFENRVYHYLKQENPYHQVSRQYRLQDVDGNTVIPDFVIHNHYDDEIPPDEMSIVECKNVQRLRIEHVNQVLAYRRALHYSLRGEARIIMPYTTKYSDRVQEYATMRGVILQHI